MKRIIMLCIALCATFLSWNVYAKVSCRESKGETYCQKHNKKKSPVKKPRAKTKVVPKQRFPTEITAQAETARKPALTRKQEDMRDAFVECIRHTSATDPTGATVDFVFQRQTERQQSPLVSLWKRFRGSVEHHGHEICLVRAYGLKGFRTQADIDAEAGKLLVPLDPQFIEIPWDPKAKQGVPPEMQFTRPWVRDYVTQLVVALRAEAAAEGVSQSELLRLRMTDMVRTFASQAGLVRRGLSPADCRYEFLCSSHTSASATDFGFKNVTPWARNWLEKKLIADQKARKIFFIIENSHYHVFVLPPAYMGEE